MNNAMNSISRKVMLALSAGMIGLAPTVVQAMPTGMSSSTATKTLSRGNTVMKITGSKTNNVINWDTFSIARNEKVQFTDKNNYLNVVNGASTSEINGVLRGGNNVYLINPNGVLFGTRAKVKVGGQFQASTRPVSDLDTATWEKGDSTSSPLTSTAKDMTGNISNLGSVQATAVAMEGNDIVLLDPSKMVDQTGKQLTATLTTGDSGVTRTGYTAIVDGSAKDTYKNADGKIVYKTLTDAVKNEGDGATILIQPGTYRDKVLIESKDVTLVGADTAKYVRIVNDQAEGSKISADYAWTVTSSSKGVGDAYGMDDATITVDKDATGFRAYSMTVSNDFVPEDNGLIAQKNSKGELGAAAQALAFRNGTDNSLLWNCDFVGRQDTIYAYKHGAGENARQYYKSCYIDGDVDYVCGAADIVVENSELHTLFYRPSSLASGVKDADGNYVPDKAAAFISVPKDFGKDQDIGFLFINCNLTSSESINGAQYYALGRPWSSGGQVKTLFKDSTYDSHVLPAGWYYMGDNDAKWPWFQSFYESNPTYVNADGTKSTTTLESVWESLSGKDQLNRKIMDKDTAALHTVENYLAGTNLVKDYGDSATGKAKYPAKTTTAESYKAASGETTIK